MESNVALRSNLMLDDPVRQREQHRYVPGDYVGQIYPGMVDSRVYATYLTKRQIIEMQQYLACVRCNKPCAGTCGR